MKPGKDIGKQEYLFKLKARLSFFFMEAPTYKRSWGYLVESSVKAGGYFPRLTALFTLICRTSSQMLTTLQNAYCSGKMGHWKDRLSVAKYLRIPTCHSGTSVSFAMRAHSMIPSIFEDVRPGAWEVALLRRLLGNRWRGLCTGRIWLY